MCLNPLKRFAVGKTANGKVQYVIMSRDTDYVYHDGTSWRAGRDAMPYAGKSYVRDGLLTPCGQCIECRLAKSREWAARMVLEQQYHAESYFLTLTYDNDHVPVSYYGDPETGEAYESLTLRKPDVSAFVKRLRAKLEYYDRPPIRFYGCGEYGDETHRPHYHVIVFGLHLDDLEYVGKNFRGEKYWKSEFVQSCWEHGHILIGDVTLESCAYVARYVTKKWTGDYKQFYETFNLEPEFSLMSRRPGIGRQYYDDHADEIYRTDEINLSTITGGKVVKPPKYYDSLYEHAQPELLEYIKSRRQADAEARQAVRRRQSNLSDEEIYAAQRRLYEKRYAMLKRK